MQSQYAKKYENEILGILVCYRARLRSEVFVVGASANLQTIRPDFSMENPEFRIARHPGDSYSQAMEVSVRVSVAGRLGHLFLSM